MPAWATRFCRRWRQDRLDHRQLQAKRLRAFESPEPVREVSLVRSRLFAKKKIADSIAQQIQANVARKFTHQTRQAID